MNGITETLRETSKVCAIFSISEVFYILKFLFFQLIKDYIQQPLSSVSNHILFIEFIMSLICVTVIKVFFFFVFFFLPYYILKQIMKLLAMVVGNLFLLYILT